MESVGPRRPATTRNLVRSGSTASASRATDVSPAQCSCSGLMLIPPPARSGVLRTRCRLPVPDPIPASGRPVPAGRVPEPGAADVLVDAYASDSLSYGVGLRTQGPGPNPDAGRSSRLVWSQECGHRYPLALRLRSPARPSPQHLGVLGRRNLVIERRDGTRRALPADPLEMAHLGSSSTSSGPTACIVCVTPRARRTANERTASRHRQ